MAFHVLSYSFGIKVVDFGRVSLSVFKSSNRTVLFPKANSIILGMVMREILRLNEQTTKENLKYQSVR